MATALVYTGSEPTPTYSLTNLGTITSAWRLPSDCSIATFDSTTTWRVTDTWEGRQQVGVTAFTYSRYGCAEDKTSCCPPNWRQDGYFAPVETGALDGSYLIYDEIWYASIELEGRQPFFACPDLEGAETLLTRVPSFSPTLQCGYFQHVWYTTGSNPVTRLYNVTSILAQPVMFYTDSIAVDDPENTGPDNTITSGPRATITSTRRSTTLGTTESNLDAPEDTYIVDSTLLPKTSTNILATPTEIPTTNVPKEGPTPGGASSSLAPAAIGGIVAGLIVLFALLGFLFFFCLRRRRQNKPFQDPPTAPAVFTSKPLSDYPPPIYQPYENSAPTQEARTEAYNTRISEHAHPASNIQEHVFIPHAQTQEHTVAPMLTSSQEHANILSSRDRRRFGAGAD